MGKRTELSFRTVPKLFGVREAKETRAEWDLVAVMIKIRRSLWRRLSRSRPRAVWAVARIFPLVLVPTRREATSSPTPLRLPFDTLDTLDLTHSSVSPKFKAGRVGNHVALKILKPQLAFHCRQGVAITIIRRVTLPLFGFKFVLNLVQRAESSVFSSPNIADTSQTF